MAKAKDKGKTEKKPKKVKGEGKAKK